MIKIYIITFTLRLNLLALDCNKIDYRWICEKKDGRKRPRVNILKNITGMEISHCGANPWTNNLFVAG